jgi:epoxyqueuosine reductase
MGQPPSWHDVVMDPAGRTNWICNRARELGFELCGIVTVDHPHGLDELAHLPEWLDRGYAGEMQYLYDPRRSDPSLAMPGARSFIVVALNYNSPHPYSTDVLPLANSGDDLPRGWISRYAWGDDYHQVLWEKLNALTASMHAEWPEPFEARAYADTGPILERVAAKHAGLGWLAKNTCFINEDLGSWLFLGTIVTTLKLEPSVAPAELPAADLCGNCTLCLDACPTQAFPAPYVLDARKCISYLTIELRGSIPEALRPQMGRAVIGCDICQDVCPWNRKSATTSLPAFQPRSVSATIASDTESSLFAPELEWIASLTQEDFSRIFRGSAIKRAKWRGIVRNACVALGNSQLDRKSKSYPRVISLLQQLSASPEPLIAEHANWALDRLQ